MSPTGVLVMAHGTPERPEDLEAFYTRIRAGRPPTAGQLADLRRRYEAIGGLSPLSQRTEAQVAGIAKALEDAHPGHFLVRFGAKHTDPSIEEAVAGLIGGGAERVVGLVLTPQRSSMGSGQYYERATEAVRRAAGGAVGFASVADWHDHPVLVGLLAERLRGCLGANPAAVGAATVLFTAHSLPERILAGDDPYPDQVAETSAAVAAAAELDERGVAWQVAWQSAGRTPDPWIGPDVLAVIRRLGEGRTTTVVVCPVGFVSDHLEVLFDLDVEAAAVARRDGLAFCRTPSLNDDPRFLGMLADLVISADPEAGASSGRPRS